MRERPISPDIRDFRNPGKSVGHARPPLRRPQLASDWRFGPAPQLQPLPLEKFSLYLMRLSAFAARTAQGSPDTECPAAATACFCLRDRISARQAPIHAARQYESSDSGRGSDCRDLDSTTSSYGRLVQGGVTTLHSQDRVTQRPEALQILMAGARVLARRLGQNVERVRASAAFSRTKRCVHAQDLFARYRSSRTAAKAIERVPPLRLQQRKRLVERIHETFRTRVIPYRSLTIQAPGPLNEIPPRLQAASATTHARRPVCADWQRQCVPLPASRQSRIRPREVSCS